MKLNTLYNLDCMIGMKEFPDKFFDLAIVDPPYGIGDFNQPPSPSKPGNKFWPVKWNNKMPEKNYFNELFRVSKEQIIWGANYYRPYINFGGTIVWDKCNKSPVGSACEIAAISSQNKVDIYYQQWTGAINNENCNKHARIHPCQKPIQLYKWLLKNYATPDMKIIDTHVGSGSSIIAFEDFGCEYIGFEIDKDYYKAATKRINQHKAQYKLDLKQ